MSFKHQRTSKDGTLNTSSTAPHAQYAIYGTPLPEYDASARDDGSYIPIWKQEVTDDKGRKRLHGAFTGGWSAGYFNTVGSKEGWTPSSFVTSRTKRAKTQDNVASRVQSIDDFMDDEDRADLAASQRLETQDSFAGLGVAHASKSDQGIFAEMFRAVDNTIGSKLLQKMGWKPGQGVGARIERRAKGDNVGSTHLFAPDNTRIISFTRKHDRKGLAYHDEAKLDQLHALSTEGNEDIGERDPNILQRPLQRNKKASIPKLRTGFGVGVLNDTGSDEEDPYTLGPQIQHNRVISDRRKKKGGLSYANSSSGKAKDVTPKQKGALKIISNSSRCMKCHDGRKPLPGFVLAESNVNFLANPFPPPLIPSDWKSSRVSGPAHAVNPEFQSTSDAARGSRLEPRSRADLLDEQPLPGKSVFDYLSANARERLSSATGNQNLPRALGEGPPPGFEASEAAKRKTLWDLVPPLNKETALAALQRGNGGWMPYGEEEAKRARYRHFIELRAGIRSSLPERHAQQSIDEWRTELSEFAQAAEVFKPVSGLMASRFTSSTSKPKLASDAPEQPATIDEPEDPAEKAAKMNLFGPLTRSTQAFLPTRLLCKRFGVRPPATPPENSFTAGDNAPMSGMMRLDVVSQASLDRLKEEAGTHASGQPSSSPTSVNMKSAQHEGLQKPVEVNWEQNDAVEGDRAGEAVFKAIFGSDDESD